MALNHMNDNQMSIGAEDGLLALLDRVSEAALLVNAIDKSNGNDGRWQFDSRSAGS